MKKYELRQLIGVVAVTAFIVLLPARATQGSTADTDMERALVTSGFKVKTAATEAQRAQLRGLPADRITMVKQDGKTYYLYPDKRQERLYAGDQWAYQAYKGYVKNNHLRKEGAFVFELNPTDKANNRTVQEWHGWSPFPAWAPANVKKP